MNLAPILLQTEKRFCGGCYVRTLLQAVLDSSAVRVTDRAAMYRKSGWTTFDPNATPYTPDQVRKERGLY